MSSSSTVSLHKGRHIELGMPIARLPMGAIPFPGNAAHIAHLKLAFAFDPVTPVNPLNEHAALGVRTLGHLDSCLEKFSEATILHFVELG